MARKPSDTAHVNLRIRESLRKKLADAADKQRYSLNNEIRIRLEKSFGADVLQTTAEVASDIDAAWARLSRIFHELNKQGDLLRAALSLVDAIERDDSNAIKDGVIRVKQIGHLIEREGAALPSRMHTTGAQ